MSLVIPMPKKKSQSKKEEPPQDAEKKQKRPAIKILKRRHSQFNKIQSAMKDVADRMVKHEEVFEIVCGEAIDAYIDGMERGELPAPLGPKSKIYEDD